MASGWNAIYLQVETVPEELITHEILIRNNSTTLL